MMRSSVLSCTAFICLLLAATGFLSVTVQAAEIPAFDKRISMAAREQPVSEFFAELFGQLDLPVNVDPDIVGTVNGDFQGTARDIYRDVGQAFQLVMYFDRSTVFIYSSTQMSTKILPMSESMGKKVLYNTKKMKIGDSMNTLEWSDMGLVVSGTERYRNQVESYAHAISKRKVKPEVAQSEEVQEVIKVFKLKYAWADDTSIVSGGQELQVRGVATLLRTVVDTGMVSVAPENYSQRSNLPRTEQGLRGQGLLSVGRAKAIADNNTQTIDSNNQIANLNSAHGSTSSTRIVADPLNNAVIIRDRADRMQNYQDLIDSLDIEPQMVEIEATIIDMDTERLRDLGIDWRYQNDGTSVLVGSAAATSALLGANPAAVVEGLNGFTQNVLNNKSQFITHIKALETQGAARIVSKPHVMTLANVEALLDTSSTFFIRVAGREEVDLFNVSVGTTMRVTPHVFSHGDRSQIKLKIDIIDGSQSLQTVDDIPVIDESTINTQAIINAGQSLLIGGLVREFKTTGVSKVPILGDIPGVGALFRSNTKSSSRMERMFLITPRLNTQATQSKRYSVPILAGSEQQILESASSRLAPAIAGLAARDAKFPIKQSLVTGGANASLNVDGLTPKQFVITPEKIKQSNSAAESSVQKPPVTELPWQEVRSVEPLPQQRQFFTIKNQPVSKVLPARVTASSSPIANPTLAGNNDEWIALPNTRKPKQSVRSMRAVKAMPASNDGWNEIIK